ncbi:hypothetical protein BDN67DRAFT_1072942 [Paxillus ammoniavirescens]|nr:hypothetical protein BDN67DRAFT_1072942 [Paxillus ammoniavirescens]
MPTTPKAIITFNCLVLGGGPRNVFSVEIDKTKNVYFLKALIRSENPIAFRDSDPDELIIWEAPGSLLCDCNDNAFKETIEGLDLQDEHSLFNLDGLSCIFSDLDPECLHVIVKAPGK